MKMYAQLSDGSFKCVSQMDMNCVVRPTRTPVCSSGMPAGTSHIAATLATVTLTYAPHLILPYPSRAMRPKFLCLI